MLGDYTILLYTQLNFPNTTKDDFAMAKKASERNITQGQSNAQLLFLRSEEYFFTLGSTSSCSTGDPGEEKPLS